MPLGCTWLLAAVASSEPPCAALHRSCVGVWQPNGVQIIANEHGNRTTPSCVTFTDSECLIGEAEAGTPECMQRAVSC